jgi:hypothetical protein
MFRAEPSVWDLNQMIEKYVKRGANTASRMLGGEMMVMSVTDSKLFSLNEIASVIWQAADGITPLSQIATAKIAAQYEVDREIAYQDALEFAAELANHGIITISDEPAAGREKP